MVKRLLPFLFCLAALALLSFKLMTRCKICGASPYVPLIGIGYFSALLIAILSFRTLPAPIKCGGLAWSIGLAFALSYLAKRPCSLCQMAHACHIMIWISWRSHPKQCINNKI